MNLEQVYDFFQEYFQENPVTGKWPMISSLYPIMFITLAYLYFIYVAGPRYMKDKPPYTLKSFILFYNIFQIFANAWIVKEHIRCGWFTKYSIKCWENDDSFDIQLFNVIWWVLLLKLFDYIETCVFVLRKKQNQVSALHVYHHVSVVTFTWLLLKYFPDIKATFIALLNSSVHIIMYTYYFCAAYDSRIQRILIPIKPYVTKIQMVQFFGMLMYGGQIISPDCKVKGGVNVFYLFLVNVTIYLYLFYDFYKKNYIKATTQITLKPKI